MPDMMIQSTSQLPCELVIIILNFTYEITEVQRKYKTNNILKRLTEGILWSLTKSPFEAC